MGQELLEEGCSPQALLHPSLQGFIPLPSLPFLPETLVQY